MKFSNSEVHEAALARQDIIWRVSIVYTVQVQAVHVGLIIRLSAVIQ